MALRSWLPALLLGLAGLAALPAAAQPVPLMEDACSRMARDFFSDREARTDMRYAGARVDGTETVRGDIFLETRAAFVACAFSPRSGQMIEFFVDGQDHTHFAMGGPAQLPSPPSAGGHVVGSPGPGGPWRPGFFRVTGVAPNDVLNLRAAPSPRARIVGALPNGARVRNLGCRSEGRGRWCRVGLLDEMGGEGWASARYLTAAGHAGGGRPPARPPHGGRPPAPGVGEIATERVRFPAGQTGVELVRRLAPGASTRYVLSARSRQDLDVRVAHRSGPRVDFQIFNPDGTFLLTMIPTDREYRGQLWQSGDHVIELINRRGAWADYTVIFGVR